MPPCYKNGANDESLIDRIEQITVQVEAHQERIEMLESKHPGKPEPREGR
jgi:hypothetical protein